jgi:hypothetical protein
MRLTVIVQMNLRVDAIVVMVPAMFAADVMSMNPMMTVVRPMAWNPNHFIFALPVTRAMAVVWLVTEFDAKSRLCRKGGPESEARYDERNEQCCFLNHIN